MHIMEGNNITFTEIEQKVTIPLAIYEEFVRLNERVNVIVESLAKRKYLSEEDVLWLIGTESSCRVAEDIIEERRERLRCQMKESEEKRQHSATELSNT